MRTYFSFGLILRDIPNSITRQNTDSGRTARTPLYPSVQPVPLYPLFFFSCPGERNRRRPVSVRVTGVRYNNLFLMGTLNTLTWPDLDIFKHFIYGYVALDIGRLSRPSNARSIPFSDYLLISWFVFARTHTHTHTHTVLCLWCIKVGTSKKKTPHRSAIG